VTVTGWSRSTRPAGNNFPDAPITILLLIIYIWQCGIKFTDYMNGNLLERLVVSIA
jgi:hypothetical protein